MPLIAGSVDPTHRSRWLRWVFRFWHPGFLLVPLCGAVALAYWPGLSGPLLLDDLANLDPVLSWLKGEASLPEVVFGNQSGVLGRPVSMLSFVANAALSGDSVFGFKLVNLLLHLACGVLVFLLLHTLARRTEARGSTAVWLALATSALWLAHPIQVSTVLYVVQRMAQLGTLFVLLALLSYAAGRAALDHGHRARANVLLFLAFPLATVLAALSKENGLLAPLLCLAIEWGCLRGPHRWPRHITAFFALFLFLPGIAALVGLAATEAQLVLASYELRDFTPVQRLLTQFRVLSAYLGVIVFPHSSSLGLYHDGFVVSRGLMQPATTLAAVGFWSALLVSTWRVRSRVPLFATGVAFFLAGHALESSVFGLELYFEHRNYLPLAGALLAIVSVVRFACGRLIEHGRIEPKSVAAALAVSVVAALVSTHWQARVWSSMTGIVRQGIASHPDSIRAHADMAGLLVESGRAEAALQTLDTLARKPGLEARRVGILMREATRCHTHGDASAAALEPLFELAGPRISPMQTQAFEMLGRYALQARCGTLTTAHLVPLVLHFLETSVQTEGIHVKWRLRLLAGRLLRASGERERGLDQLRTAWASSGSVPDAGMALVESLAEDGQDAEAVAMVQELQRRVTPSDHDTRSRLAEISLRLGRPR